MKKGFLLLCLACNGAFAMTGSELVARLHSKDPATVLQAHSYVAGVLDAENIFLNQQKFAAAGAKDKKMAARFFCAPEGTTARKVVDVISPKIDAGGAAGKESADALIRSVLLETWPCPGNP